MYQITYNYFRRDKNRFEPIGQPIFRTVKGKTLKELNRNWLNERENHDVFQYTQMNFCSIEEV